MAVKPKQATLNATSVQILNSIRAEASDYYTNLIPYAEETSQSIKEIGNIMMSYEPLQNEFLTAIYNRIAQVLITSKMFYNPWQMFKKGLVELGETTEEIFVNIAKAHTFDPETAQSEFMKREIPDVRAAFHTMNYQKFYKATISNEQLRQAFVNWSGITDLIARIVDSMYTAHNYDEFQAMKYLLAKQIVAGNLTGDTVPLISKENASDIVTEIKTISNELAYETKSYNYSGVYTNSEKDSQYIITTARFDALMDVNVLASAFNMDKAEFMGHRVQIDGFDRLDETRLEQLFGDDFTPLTENEKEMLAKIPAVLVDRDYFMIFDNLHQFTNDYNGQGLYWQYWYHTWKTFSVSPFANAVMFIPGEQTVTGVTISPETATINKGTKLKLTANVETTNFAPTSVYWSLSSGSLVVDTDQASITQAGEIYIKKTATVSEVTVYATSRFDNTKTATATITIV